MNKLIKKYNYLKDINERNKQKYNHSDTKPSEGNQNKIKLPRKENFNSGKRKKLGYKKR